MSTKNTYGHMIQVFQQDCRRFILAEGNWIFPLFKELYDTHEDKYFRPLLISQKTNMKFLPPRHQKHPEVLSVWASVVFGIIRFIHPPTRILYIFYTVFHDSNTKMALL